MDIDHSDHGFVEDESEPGDAEEIIVEGDIDWDALMVALEPKSDVLDPPDFESDFLDFAVGKE
jgi:hypothetical protein